MLPNPKNAPDTINHNIKNNRLVMILFVNLLGYLRIYPISKYKYINIDTVEFPSSELLNPKSTILGIINVGINTKIKVKKHNIFRYCSCVIFSMTKFKTGAMNSNTI